MLQRIEWEIRYGAALALQSLSAAEGSEVYMASQGVIHAALALLKDFVDQDDNLLAESIAGILLNLAVPDNLEFMYDAGAVQDLIPVLDSWSESFQERVGEILQLLAKSEVNRAAMRRDGIVDAISGLL